MTRRLPIALAGSIAAASALVLTATAFAGGNVNVAVFDDDFAPDPVNAGVGEGGITWQWDAGNSNQHNVVQDNKLFRSGQPASTQPDFHIDDSAGTFPYHCEVHGAKGGQGMSGTLRITPTRGLMKRGSAEIIWATGSGDTGNQFDVQYRKQGASEWKDWKKNTSQLSGEFGGNNKPIDVDPSKTYEVRARSERASNPKKKHSGFSPPLIVNFT